MGKQAPEPLDTGLLSKDDLPRLRARKVVRKGWAPVRNTTTVPLSAASTQDNRPEVEEKPTSSLHHRMGQTGDIKIHK